MGNAASCEAAAPAVEVEVECWRESERARRRVGRPACLSAPSWRRAGVRPTSTPPARRPGREDMPACPPWLYIGFLDPGRVVQDSVGLTYCKTSISKCLSSQIQIVGGDKEYIYRFIIGFNGPLYKYKATSSIIAMSGTAFPLPGYCCHMLLKVPRSPSSSSPYANPYNIVKGACLPLLSSMVISSVRT